MMRFNTVFPLGIKIALLWRPAPKRIDNFGKYVALGFTPQKSEKIKVRVTFPLLFYMPLCYINIEL